MLKNETVRGIKLQAKKMETCEACCMGKIHRRTYQTAECRGKWKVGEAFHSDICGPMDTESLRGAKYFVTFIDDASG